MVKKIIRYSLITIAILLSLSFLITVLVKVPRVQTFLVQKAAGFLSNKLHTNVSVGSVNITFFRTADIGNIYVEDQRHDTLLALGNLEVKIGLFSLFGKQAQLNLIELDNATVNIFRGRNDSDFNFQFIIDAFTPKNTTTRKDGTPFKFSVSDFGLRNIKFDLRDESSANEVKVNLRQGDFNFNKLDLGIPLLDLKNTSIDKADVAFTDFSYLYPETNSPKDTGIVHVNTKAFKLLCKKFVMTDCSFTMNTDTLKPAKDEFDPAHIGVSSINMDIENGTFIKDTIQGQFKDFSAMERSGFVVKHISANTRITPKQITLKQLDIKTNNSEVKNYFQMNFHDFRAFTNYSNRVTMKGNLDNCKISFFDLAYFAPAVKDVIDKTLLADGEVSGPVNNLRGKNFKLWFGSNGAFNGDIELTGLPNIDETFADIDVRQLTARAYDLKELLPSLKLPDNIATLGQINFNGNYTGFFNDFVAYGTFNTHIGSVNTDINFKVDKHNHASYSGNFSADSFNVGRFFDVDSLLGSITFKGEVNGSGLRSDNVSAQMKGDISQFIFNHYDYHDLTVFGKFDRKEFNGKLCIYDKNLGLDFSGTVDFNDTIPKFNFIANVADAHLQNLHFANKDFVLNSTMKLNLSGNDLDNAIGDVNIEHTKFKLIGKNYEIDSIHLNSSVNLAQKVVTLKSDVLDAALTGNFHLDNFYDSFIAMMKHYFPSWPVTAKENTVAQNINFNVNVKNAEPFTNFFFPDITGLTGSTATGTINTSEKNITMTGLIPEFNYKNFKFQAVNLSIDVTKHDRLRIGANTKNLSLSDSMSAQNVDVSFAVRNDSALCHFRTADSSFANRVNFSGWIIGTPDSIKFSFFKSAFYVSNVEWKIPDDNSITYTKDHILINNLLVQGPGAQITFSGVKANVTNTLTASFANVRIEDFYNLLKIHDYSVYGLLNGKLTVINPLLHPHITSDLTVDGLRLNTDTLGQVVADIVLDTMQQNVNFNFNIKRDNSEANVTGLYNLYGDSGLTANINLKDMKMALATPFLTGLASDIRGSCNGTLQLKGTLGKPQLTGKVLIPSAEASIDYLKTHYKFKNETVEFTDNLISVDTVTLYDSYNNKATLGGEIFHDHLTEFRLNLWMNTKNFLVLNTTPRDNDLFYGKAFGSGTVYFTGPLNDLEIDAEIKSEKNTVISIPISEGQSVTDRNFIRFISNKDQVSKTDSAVQNNGNLKLNFDLDVTPDALINIILDQTTGDIIKGNGNGNLRMEINTAGTFNMYGNYTIENGSYLFTYKGIINKHFTIDNGGTINWNGDPYKARINISALYSLKTNLSSLISTGQPGDQQTASQTVPVNVVMNLTGSLLTPNIDFDISVPDQSSSFSDLALSRLQQIRQDKNELNKQVVALLATNSFIPEQSSTSQLASSTAITSLSEFFTNQLSSMLSTNKTNINVNYYSYSDNPSTTNPSDALTGKEFAADVSHRLLNDRLTVTVGGNIDVNSAPTSQNSSTNLAGDFDIDYLLTPDGRYTLKAFRKNQYDDIAQQNISITGVGISFKKEFNKFKEIFRRTNKKK